MRWPGIKDVFATQAYPVKVHTAGCWATTWYCTSPRTKGRRMRFNIVNFESLRRLGRKRCPRFSWDPNINKAILRAQALLQTELRPKTPNLWFCVRSPDLSLDPNINTVVCMYHWRSSVHILLNVLTVDGALRQIPAQDPAPSRIPAGQTRRNLTHQQWSHPRGFHPHLILGMYFSTQSTRWSFKVPSMKKVRGKELVNVGPRKVHKWLHIKGHWGPWSPTYLY